MSFASRECFFYCIFQVMNGVSGPMTVRVYHELAQPDHPNKCASHECEHMCLPKAHLRMLLN